MNLEKSKRPTFWNEESISDIVNTIFIERFVVHELGK